jgi:hypothetical protein
MKKKKKEMTQKQFDKAIEELSFFKIKLRGGRATIIISNKKIYSRKNKYREENND